MAKVKAVILAAGRGVRMGGQTPKALIHVRGYEPLLYYALKGLKRAGVTDLLVVTGYKPSEIQNFVGEHWSDDVQFVFNARYASWGNFHSLRMAFDQIPGYDALVLNSDVVMAPDVFTAVIEKQGDLVLAVEKRRDLDDEDMRVTLQRDRVLAIGKDLPRHASHGEFDGVSLVRPEAARRYLEIATDLEWLNDTNVYYEDVYARMLGTLDARAAFVTPGDYAEVDEWTDMEAAARVIAAHEGAWADVSTEQPAAS